MSKPVIQLDEKSTTVDIYNILHKCHSDEEIEECVSIIQYQGKNLYGVNFNIRFDRSIKSGDIKRRIWIQLGKPE
ncbi:hypothetical protein JK182_09550 [Acetobacter okinawensis]|uniref:hypothetical protein n=1 Tax=Acetobacter okinawensis TaxID=1076594 RepID=UPI001BA4646F|nr:hypothetical protein [Acetobacter okinawensis]MBS0988905.1 hypothetical protein [Acetobacter okinawensis]